MRSAVSSLSNPQRWLVDMFGGGTSKAGVDVSEESAVKVTAVFACVRLLAQTLASLPLHVYRRVENGKEKATDHPLYVLLHSLPNPECTSYNMRLIMMINLLLTGHAFAEVERHPGTGQVTALWPIPSNKVWIKRNRQTKEVYYEVSLPDGGVKRLYPEQMLHVPWVGMENLKSFRPVTLAREAIGLAIAAEEYGARFFEGGANASGIAEYPGKLSDEAYARFVKSFNEKYSGLNKSHRVMFLEEGLKFTKLTIDPTDAQALETRKFQVIEIARFYNVPPHLIMDVERATFSNIEHQDISFVKYSLRPYLVCWEQEIFKSLFLRHEREVYFAEFNVDGLLRGDTKSRAEALDIMMRNGVINADEWRALENMNPQADELGKIYYVPLNWVPKGQAQNPPPEKDERGENTEFEKRTRQKNSALGRARAAARYERMFEDAAARIVAREKAQILDKARRSYAKRSESEFLAWLERFYEEAPEWMKRAFVPVLLTYAETIQELAAADVDAKTGMSEELIKWMDGYADIWARNYTGSSLGQIKAVIRKANEEGSEPLEAIEERLTEWEERRPGKVAANETVEAAGVVSKFVYRSAGIRYLRWVAVGSESCPFCQELHGRIVGIDRAFVEANDQLDSEDGVMRINKPAFAPPLHEGCVCQIVPE